MRKGWRIADGHVYVDDGISGAEFANRPGFIRLMNALKPRAPFQVLVMSEESRLGRESIETAYALKQLVQAGVRVFFYLEDRERTLDSPTDKIMLSLTTFADELEREKARQRVSDAMQRKARAGHVTGGRCFGYDNVDVTDAEGRRTHVDRRINDAEAAVVREIFSRCAAGQGIKSIAKALNARHVPTPQPADGSAPRGWAPSAIRSVLYRRTYLGEIRYGMTKKRDAWGQRRTTRRPASDLIVVSQPTWRIISDTEWQAAHERLEAVRGVYLRSTKGRPFGRPLLGNPSKYLLTNLALCGCCGGPLKVRSRPDRRYYGCSGYHDRGTTVCTNQADAPMTIADSELLAALLDDVLDPSVIHDSVDEAIRLLRGENVDTHAERLDAELARVLQERDRLVAAIASGGQLEGLVAALQARERRRQDLEAQRAALVTQPRLKASEAGRVRRDLMARAASWRDVLTEDPEHARPIVCALLTKRVTITPTSKGKWILTGEGTVAGLFTRELTAGNSRMKIVSLWDGAPGGTCTLGEIKFSREFRAA